MCPGVLRRLLPQNALPARVEDDFISFAMIMAFMFMLFALLVPFVPFTFVTIMVMMVSEFILSVGVTGCNDYT